MSIILGKRNFIQNFTEPGLSDHAFNHLYISKKSKFSATNPKLEISHLTKTANQNIQMLKDLYPNISEQEITSVLFDCDENVSIAKEILSKQVPKELNSTAMIESPIKTAPQGGDRRFISLKFPKSNLNQINIMNKEPHYQKQNMIIIENKKPEVVENQIKIQEEEPIHHNNPKNEEIKNLSEFIINKLYNITNLDEAKHSLQQILKEFHGEIDKKNEGLLKKLNEERAILIKAFNKQREKTTDLTEKNNELQNQLDNAEQEINKLKLINYKLGLRLKSLDLTEEEKVYFQIC